MQPGGSVHSSTDLPLVCLLHIHFYVGHNAEVTDCKEYEGQPLASDARRGGTGLQWESAAMPQAKRRCR